MKLRPKVLLLVLGILIVSLGVLSIPLYWYARSALEDELNKRLLTVCRLTRKNLQKDLVTVLVREPSLVNVRAALEEDLSSFMDEELEGMALWRHDGTELAEIHKDGPGYDQMKTVLQAFAGSDAGLPGSVSEIYELSGGNYIKAAAVPMDVGEGSSAVLVIWGGAEFMTVIDQIAGSVFWIVLVSIVVAISLGIVFSRSLIRPVRELSTYAHSIRKNIYSKPVDLGRTDEFGDLNRSLNKMHSEIKEHEQSTKQLLSGIAHEIKNPLGGIEIYSGLLKEELARSEEHRSYLEKITRELHHLKQIVTEYLDYARPVKSELKPLAMESILEDAYRILLPEMKQKKVKYALKGKGIVSGDESKLRRVFVNLLKNSLDAVGEEGAITVAIHNLNGAVDIEVSDNGHGIPRENFDDIFQPYFTTHDKGYGLGLTIAKNIIDEMNGTIIVESKEGKGTTFTVKLPAETGTSGN